MALKVADWSIVPGSNSSVDGVAIQEGCAFANMNNAVRAVMSSVRYEVASIGANVSASGTPDIASVGGALTMLGVTTVTGFATAPAGLLRTIHFETATPIVPGANLSAPFTSITMQKGDVQVQRSLGSGAWKVEYNSRYVESLTTIGTRGHIAGLTLSNNVADANNDIDIAVGAATAANQSAVITLASALTKRLDASWAVGTNQGGLDGTESVAGTPDVSTWYFVWLIRRSDTGVVDVLFSESATAPTMPTNYDQKRRIGAVFNNSSGDIVAFTQIGDDFMWSTAVAFSSTTASTTAALATLRVPTGIKVKAKLTASVASSAGGGASLFTAPDMSDQAATAPLSQLRWVASAAQSVGLELWTNTSGQVRHRESVTSASIAIDGSTLGWTDRRGRDD